MKNTGTEKDSGDLGIGRTEDRDLVGSDLFDEHLGEETQLFRGRRTQTPRNKIVILTLNITILKYYLII